MLRGWAALLQKRRGTHGKLREKRRLDLSCKPYRVPSNLVDLFLFQRSWISHPEEKGCYNIEFRHLQNSWSGFSSCYQILHGEFCSTLNMYSVD
ncbi:hypothetical protein L6164_031354 [Bauhinia variegata]|uniref:Uncharacterized protein n=1 Tax=Bauhinia variegata TaxID=167791 RepID=A0ACB9LEQ3_BAUVA|nr:hypothetical protein L6164_031354 [Bauhinia variegata]